ncbi:MAG: hypothetical protein KIT11_05495 [Fimbriimonadaceae bacterium]|nr:hypothetical protein [Fimbriimonadaceae bacterium]QYK56653.1 MAG: hypothetical protein KF733_04025 [Fimbriimonadaceae bacterium]
MRRPLATASCRKCRSQRVKVVGKPPAACFVECAACGERYQVCGAERKDGRRCLSIQCFPNGRCRMHKGKAAAGAAHPNFKHGRRSKFMPAPLAEIVEEALADDTLLGLEEDVALIDGLISQELQALAAETPAEMWAKAILVFRALAPDSETKETVKVDKGRLTALGEMLSNGFGERSRRAELVALAESRAKIAAAEHRRRQFLAAHVDAATLRVFLAQLQADIMEVVRDPEQRREIGRRIAARLGAVPGGDAHGRQIDRGPGLPG